MSIINKLKSKFKRGDYSLEGTKEYIKSILDKKNNEIIELEGKSLNIKDFIKERDHIYTLRINNINDRKRRTEKKNNDREVIILLENTIQTLLNEKNNPTVASLYLPKPENFVHVNHPTKSVNNSFLPELDDNNYLIPKNSYDFTGKWINEYGYELRMSNDYYAYECSLCASLTEAFGCEGETFKVENELTEQDKIIIYVAINFAPTGCIEERDTDNAIKAIKDSITKWLGFNSDNNIECIPYSTGHDAPCGYVNKEERQNAEQIAKTEYLQGKRETEYIYFKDLKIYPIEGYTHKNNKNKIVANKGYNKFPQANEMISLYIRKITFAEQEWLNEIKKYSNEALNKSINNY